jgi:hypothetical protein
MVGQSDGSNLFAQVQAEFQGLRTTNNESGAETESDPPHSEMIGCGNCTVDLSRYQDLNFSSLL